jgi:ubiquinone/menaquinone biosynthesis C-methylase UbiE
VRQARSRRKRRRSITHDATRARFAATADRIAELQHRRADELAARVREFLPLNGDERALDAGTGTGALAFALAPLVREVVGVDLVPELLERARAQAPANVSFVEGDLAGLEFERASFDLGGTLRTLHHVPRPELAVAELTRVTRPDGLLLIVDQIAPNDPLAAVELNRFERARDPSHTRALADVDLRQLFEANGLVLLRAEFEREPRELDPYLDLAGCEGEAREQARALAPPGYTAEIAWYLLRRP